MNARCGLCHQSPMSCHMCPDLVNPDGAMELMPGCMGGVFYGDLDMCHCAARPQHPACGHCRHERRTPLAGVTEEGT